MKTYTVEMCYGLNVTVEGVEANSREEAIDIARQMVDNDIEEYADLGSLEYETVTYVSKGE